MGCTLLKVLAKLILKPRISDRLPRPLAAAAVIDCNVVSGRHAADEDLVNLLFVVAARPVLVQDFHPCRLRHEFKFRYNKHMNPDSVQRLGLDNVPKAVGWSLFLIAKALALWAVWESTAFQECVCVQTYQIQHQKRSLAPPA